MDDELNSEIQHVLVVEDDKGIQNQLKWCFDNHQVTIAENRMDALKSYRSSGPAIVLLDLGLPPDPGGISEGLKTIEDLLAIDNKVKIIVVTGNDDSENAVLSIGKGAYDFYKKPIDRDELSLVVQRASRVYLLECENENLQRNASQQPLTGIIANSEVMQAVCRTIEKVGPLDVSTLLLGESGTGKELLARALHELSQRADKPMVAINCAAIPESLLESELFGHEKGAFTGAVKKTKGKLESADGGTLFLDEIGDLPLELQAKLLRFLQERVLERVGGREQIHVDTRLVCATHRDLDEMISSGLFREDLYYRISEISIQIPPLRDRDQDSILIAKHLLNKFCISLGKPTKSLDTDALVTIQNHPWQGNIRELENRIKRAVIMSDSRKVTSGDLDLELADDELNLPTLKQARDKAEKEAVKAALAVSNGTITAAASILDITRPTLYDLIKKHGL